MKLLENIADVFRNTKSSMMPKRNFMGKYEYSSNGTDFRRCAVYLKLF